MMVSQPETVAQQRRRILAGEIANANANANANASSSSLFVRAPERRIDKPPLITYGRNNKPLSLSGNQFIRRGTYDLPSEEDEPPNAATGLLQAATIDSGSDSSALSNEDSSPGPRHSKPRDVATGPSKFDVLEAAAASTRCQPSSSASPHKKGTGKVVRKSPVKPTYPKERADQASRVLKARRGGKAPATLSKPPTKRSTAKAPARRLPVGELFLVNSPPNHDPLSSVAGIDVQDPITEQSSHVHKPGNSALETPLTSIRKRLKTPNYRHKSLTSLRRRQHRPLLFGNTNNADQQAAGDGFNASELKLTYHREMPRKRRKRAVQSALIYGSLQLVAGPLPDVAFECSTDELQLELSGGPHHVSSTQQQEERQYELPKSSTQRSRRRVSFSGRDDYIMAQLSSVSAPRRHHSDSESDEEESEVDEDEDESQVDDADVMVEGFEAAEQHEDEQEPDESEDELAGPASPPRSLEKPTESVQRSRPILRRFTPVEEIEETGRDYLGIYGSRETAQPGRAPAQSYRGRPRLMEVQETIEDVPDSEVVQVPRSNLVLHADPISSDAATREPCTSECYWEALLILVPGPRRTRSILKNSTPLAPDSTSFRLEDTEANTRRNSRLVEVDDSRYFAAAALELLDVPDPSKHQYVRRRSAYFDPAAVEVPDSGRVIPETSPQQPGDFANTSQLALLKRTSETVWTSQSLPAAPKNLKALTRTVSMENGTLSQSRRRRPSLPFQSPSKVCA